jgi:hypothetical protein
MGVTATKQGEEVFCEECEQLVSMGAPRVIRIRIGATKYARRGTVFVPATYDPEHWVHLACAERAGFLVAHRPPDKCALCHHQFYGIDSDEPYEAVMECTLGEFVWKPGDPAPEFSREDKWLVHWGCADSYTKLKVTE